MNNQIEQLVNMQKTAILLIIVLMIYLIIRWIESRKNRGIDQFFEKEKNLTENYERYKDRIDYHEKYIAILTKACKNDKNTAKRLIRFELNKDNTLSIKQATLKVIERLENDRS